MSRLLIVANRLPVTVKQERGVVSVTPSSGGLATGLKGPHEQSDSRWIGWPGDVSRFDAGQRAQLEKQLAEMRLVPVYLSQSEITRYYEGFSNGVLWPLFHYQTDRVQREAWRDWKTYVEVNQRFAEIVAGQYREGDIIWVHDYQLMLVPGILRRRLPDAVIGFFLHIPFPSSEVYRILPWRDSILDGLMGADLIGFHTYAYMRHFSSSLLYLLGLEGEDEERVTYRGREVQLGVFPMGVDAQRFSSLAEDMSVISKVEEMHGQLGDRKMLLGVDRLDYTKGLPRRMLSFERLLEREPSMRRKARLVQVVVPSRTKVETYATYRKQLDEMIGRINGQYATVNSVPIHYLYRSVPENELVALYRAAAVMVVTPLRDGMNLVAKEYVASRTDEDGVLLLSEFAGAASELAEAVMVNPYDLEGLASAMKHALLMPREERRMRMRALRRRVMAYDAFRWAESFIERLEAVRRKPAAPVPTISSTADIDTLIKRVRSVEHLLLLLDYDGTLMPFTSSPELAAPDSEVRQLLRSLAARPQTRVHVVSGRSRESLEKWLGDLPIGLHAEHGYWTKSDASSAWESLRQEGADWKPGALYIMNQYTAKTPGSLIEEKSAGIAWHYRMADPARGAGQARQLKAQLEAALGEKGAEVLVGDKIIEARIAGINKGQIVARLLAEQVPGRLIVAIGDDRTDEEMFAALPPDGIAVHVGPNPSRAPYRLADPAAARAFLWRLAGKKPAAESASASHKARD